MASWVSVWTQWSYCQCCPKISWLFYLTGSSLRPYGLRSLISIFALLDLLTSLLTPTTVSLVIVSQSIHSYGWLYLHSLYFSIDNNTRWKWINQEGLPRGNQNEITIKLSVFGPQRPSLFECIILLASFLSWILIQIVQRKHRLVLECCEEWRPISGILSTHLFRSFGIVSFPVFRTYIQTNADTISPFSQINLLNFILRSQ